jgi:hypothetical protein
MRLSRYFIDGSSMIAFFHIILDYKCQAVGVTNQHFRLLPMEIPRIMC